jgi:hypothetical protein
MESFSKGNKCLTSLSLPAAACILATDAKPCRERPGKNKPFWQKAALGATHCGAGCSLGDLCAEWLIVLTPFTLFGKEIFGAWVLDYAFAYGFGIAFQHFTIAPMGGLSFGNREDQSRLLVHDSDRHAGRVCDRIPREQMAARHENKGGHVKGRSPELFPRDDRRHCRRRQGVRPCWKERCDKDERVVRSRRLGIRRRSNLSLFQVRQEASSPENVWRGR